MSGHRGQAAARTWRRRRAWSCATSALTAELQATIDDLRASRRRLVQAQDAERQRIERNLHDGAQQQLVALTIQLGLLEDSADDPGEVRQLDRRAPGRRCAPPSMTCGPWPAASTRRCWPTRASAPALQAQAGKAPLPVEIEADGIGRYPRDAEAAVYFCILEALQNVAKYAQASRATVALSCSDGSLEFTVTDDGDRLRHRDCPHGTGLQGMADRLSAVGGTLRIESAPGPARTISGTVPVAALTPALTRLMSPPDLVISTQRSISANTPQPRYSRRYRACRAGAAVSSARI